jgi:AraC family transcriptional regulator
MRYMRGRRLSAAAKRLAAGSSDILAVALDAGYGSHEAFTRAFRELFGVTPETVRSQGSLNGVCLMEALSMSDEPMPIGPPRFVSGPVMLMAGLNHRYDSYESGAGIPAQWRQFAQQMNGIPGRVGDAAYGVCYNTDDEGGMDYLCAVEVGGFASVPDGFARLRVAAAKYAVFGHRGHISTIRGTWNSIWNQWLPQSGHESADGPILERYDYSRFDPQSGSGDVELWIPLRS